MSRTDHAADFWKWFALNVAIIKEAYDQKNYEWLDLNISPRINRIEDRLNWEIGPYHAPEDTFVLSPTIRENLSVTRAAVAIAPHIVGWHFLHAKPPKKLSSLTFSAAECTINADDWRYRLTSYNNGEFVDIEIFVNSSSRFPSAHEDLFCELVTEALIGEELRLDRVGYLMPSIVDDNSKVEKSTPIQYLRDHLSKVLAPV